MGMAASQARFLNLTAKKTNIEYQGQQINEQRTTLSNESANLYSQMLTLTVPTPPSSSDYTKISYTFMMPGNTDEATISQITQSSDNSGQYTVIFSYKTTEIGVPACTDSQKSKAFKSTDSSGNTSYSITTYQGKSYDLTKYDSDDESQKEIHGDVVSQLTTDNASFGDVYFVNVGTDANPSYQYYSGAQLAEATKDNSVTNAIAYYSVQDVETYKEDSYSPCTISRDSQNRVQSFTYNPESGTSTTFSVTTNTETDNDAYEDAMNEYTYKTYLYEQEMANMNARTSVIQAQDKTLELQLKQLDTEHNAVQTEMEDVQSVIKKNVEDTFKIFA